MQKQEQKSQNHNLICHFQHLIMKELDNSNAPRWEHKFCVRILSTKGI